MAHPPPESSFTPRKEFMPTQHIYSTFSLMTLSSSNLIRLYSFPPAFIKLLRKHLNDRGLLTATRQDAGQTCYEYTVDGRPWAAPKSIDSERLIVDLLHIILSHGYNFLSTVDYGREHDDKVAIAFSKPQPLMDRDPIKFSSSTNLGRGPSPFPSGSSATLAPQSPTLAHAQLNNEPRQMIATKVPFAVSFPSASLLRVISPPLNDTPAILQAVRSSWPRGVISEKKVGEAYEFKLRGYKWFQEDTYATDSLQHILTLLSSLDTHAFTLLTSLTLTNRSRVKDLWIFTGAGPEIPDEPLEDRDSILFPPGSSILSHSNSHADFQQPGSPLAGHRRLATVPDVGGEPSSPATPTAANPGHRRSMTEPIPQIPARQQSPLAQTILRKHTPRTQWSESQPANPPQPQPQPQPQQSRKPPPIDMTGVGAFTKPGHLRNLSLGGQPSPSIIYATGGAGARRNSEGDETPTPRAREERDAFFPNPLSPPSMYERRDPDLSALAPPKPWVQRSSAEVRNPFLGMFSKERAREREGEAREGSVRTGPRSRRASSLSPGQELGAGGRRRSRLGSMPGPLVVQNPDPTPIEEVRSNPMSPVGASAPELALPGGFGEERGEVPNGFPPPPPVITTTPPADEQPPSEFMASPSPPPQSNGGPPAVQAKAATPSPPLLSPGAFRDSAFSTGSRESGWTGTERSKSIEIPIKWTGPPGSENAARVPSDIREEDGEGVMFPGGWADSHEQERPVESAPPMQRERSQSVPMSVGLGSDIDGSGSLGALALSGDRMSRSLDLSASEVERLREQAQKEVDARVSSPDFDPGLARKSSRGVVGVLNSRGVSVLSGVTTDSRFNSILRRDASHPKQANGGIPRGPARSTLGSNAGPPPSWLPKHLTTPTPLSAQSPPRPGPSHAPPAAQPQQRPPAQPHPQLQRRVTPPKLDTLPSAAPLDRSKSQLSPRKLQKSPSDDARREREKQLAHQSSISEGWVWINVENATPRGSGAGQAKRAAGPSSLGKTAVDGDGRTRKGSHEKGGKGKFFLLGRKANAGAGAPDKKKLAKKAGPTTADASRNAAAAQPQPRVANGTSAQAQSRIPQRAGAEPRTEPRSNYRPARPK